jgi:hypothetical protein
MSEPARQGALPAAPDTGKGAEKFTDTYDNSSG